MVFLVPVGMKHFAGIVFDEFEANTQPVSFAELEHEIGGQIVDIIETVHSVLLCHVLVAKRVLNVGDEMPFPVKFKEVHFWTQLFVDEFLWLFQVPGESCRKAENVDAHVWRHGGTVRKMRQSKRCHPVQTVGDALPVFKGKVDGRIDMRSDGVVVVVFLRVEFVGEIRQADT